MIIDDKFLRRTDFLWIGSFRGVRSDSKLKLDAFYLGKQ